MTPRELQWTVKRVFEWFAALALIILTFPLQVLIAAAVRLESAGPAFYTSERLGKDGRLFRMYKFRTLRWNPAGETVLNPDGSTRVDAEDARLTRLGRLLRLGFDELPQLWNVLRGEMAIIGPRPDLPMHFSHYSQDEQRKLSVLPGISGLPQAMGRNDIPWKERIALDLYYIDRYSISLDAKIWISTVKMLITGRGIFTPGQVKSSAGGRATPSDIP